MAAIDDYIQAGFPYTKALALSNLAAGQSSANIDSLVRVGFSPVQAKAIDDTFQGTNDKGSLAASGLWAGTEVTAIDANM